MIGGFHEMLVSMSDQEYEEQVMRDLFAISNFGDIESMLADLREHRRSAQNAKQSSRLPERPSTPKRSRWRSKRNYVIKPDYDDMPSTSMGRGAALEAMGGAINGYEVPHGLSRGLLEIGSGNYRNESIEAYIDEEQTKRQFENYSDSDDDKCAAKVVDAAPPSDQTPPRPARESTAAAKARKPKKQRNVVLSAYLAKMTVAADDGAAKPVLHGESTSKVTVEPADADCDTYVLAEGVHLPTVADSFSSCELEVESQESYLLDGSQASTDSNQASWVTGATSVDCSQTSDDLVASVEALTDVSASSTTSKSSRASKRSGDRSSKSRNSYHGTSRRKRMIAVSPLPPQNPALDRRSPFKNVYVPLIVETDFSYRKRDFPPL